MPTLPANSLETFPNPAPQRDFQIHMEIPEFTCPRPKTGQPEFRYAAFRYIPDHAALN